MVEVTREQELGLERQLGKRKQTHDPTLSATAKQFDVSMFSARGPRGCDICVRGEGTHERVRNKSIYDGCRWKGHLRQEFTLAVELCHRCHHPGHIRENFPRSLVGAHVPLQVFLQEGGAEP